MEGYTVLKANNGKKGIELAVECMPDIIICDVSIPGLSSYDVLQIIKESPKTAVIPFILSASTSEKVDTSKANKLGADNYLERSFDPETLLGLIRTEIKKSRSLTLHV